MKRETWMLSSSKLDEAPKRKPIDLATKPPTSSQPIQSIHVNDDGMSWQARKIDRIYEQAKTENLPLEQVILERFGDMQEFRELEKTVSEWRQKQQNEPKMEQVRPTRAKNYRRQNTVELAEDASSNAVAAAALKAAMSGDFKTETMLKRRLDSNNNSSGLKREEKSFDMDRQFMKQWKGKQLDEVDDQAGHYSTKRKEKGKRKEPQRERIDEKEECWFCDTNGSLTISTSPRAFVALPKYDLVDPYGHLLIIPLEHSSSTLDLDSETLEEIRNYKKCIIRQFAKESRHTIFIETCILRKKGAHCIIEAISIPSDFADDVKMFLKKALADNLGEWSGSKLYELSSTKKLQQIIPKGFGFIAITIGLDNGYVHVLDKEQRDGQDEYGNDLEGLDGNVVDSKFGKGLVASMLGLEYSEWRKKEPTEENVDNMKHEFSKFDWVHLIQ